MQVQIDQAVLNDPHTATGNNSGHPDFGVQVAPGQPRPQATNENGVPLWDIECMRQIVEFGRSRTEVYTVLVPSAQQPVLSPGPVRFRDLRITVSTRVQRQGTGRESRIVGVTENVYWDASAVEQVRGSSESKGAA
ncbi:MAG: hypothetical protein V9G08_13560 [Dermatophilaceae bacterium]